MWEEMPQSDHHLELVGWVISETKLKDRRILAHFRCTNKEEFTFLRPPAIKPPGIGRENIVRCFIRRIENQDGTLSSQLVLLHWETLG